MFCKKCNKLMELKNINAEGIGKCECGFEFKVNIGHEENIKQAAEIGKGTVDGKNELATFPHLCKKCGYDKAQVIEMGVWYGDEAGVIRYRCGKCGVTEQDKDSNT